jgi:hypothetical protein
MDADLEKWESGRLGEPEREGFRINMPYPRMGHRPMATTLARERVLEYFE